MPSDDYHAVGGGGALKLKGAKVDKKKKKTKTKTDLAKNLSTGEVQSEGDGSMSQANKDDVEEVSLDNNEADTSSSLLKTASERRHEEARRKRLLQMAEQSGVRPELLKTHKERVEELNTYLSKLSEHHDMPKIGPG